LGYCYDIESNRYDVILMTAFLFITVGLLWSLGGLAIVSYSKTPLCILMIIHPARKLLMLGWFLVVLTVLTTGILVGITGIMTITYGIKII